MLPSDTSDFRSAQRRAQTSPRTVFVTPPLQCSSERLDSHAPRPNQFNNSTVVFESLTPNRYAETSSPSSSASVARAPTRVSTCTHPPASVSSTAAPADHFNELQQQLRQLEQRQDELASEVTYLHRENARLCEAFGNLEAMFEDMAVGAGAVGAPSRSPSPSPPPEHQFLAAPVFNPNTVKFYIVRKGLCPGIYSDFNWVQGLTDSLPFAQRDWNKCDSIQEACEQWNAAAKMEGRIQMTGCTDGDEWRCGPRAYQLDAFNYYRS
ncbi:hypothetical protein BKA70DRAFT_1432031 [Coprinopsis sp. MPI-PUGE-AT-0042]|nr:hypothetical protein BKA70DRAFT_1432031 [Coprinopsis sp. MPI-PUGE-AT-0042]